MDAVSIFSIIGISICILYVILSYVKIKRNKNLTKWIPIFIYSYLGRKYLLQGRKDLKTGELYFKNTLINDKNSLMHNVSDMSIHTFNPKQQLDKLIEEQ